MSQIWIYSHDLVRKDIIETDVKVKVYDCITPQKTTFEVKKNDKIHESDIILIKDEQDYLGVIDTVATSDTTEVSTIVLYSTSSISLSNTIGNLIK